MTTYATSEQLTAFLGASSPAPSDVDRLLARASEVIDQALRSSVYATDDAGAPTDAAVITALADATCAQVEFWQTADEEDDILGPLQGIALGGMQLQYGAGDNRTTPTYLAPRAHRILVNAGLRGGQPVTW